MSNLTGKLPHQNARISQTLRGSSLRKIAVFTFLLIGYLFIVTGCVSLPHKAATTQLHEPMYPKVFVIILDALKRGTLMESLDDLPNFKRIIVGKHADYPYVYFENVLCSIPSSSMPSNATLLTGVYPLRHGVPSTVWFDRKKSKTVSLTSFFQRKIIDFFEQTQTDTIFDYARRSGRTTMAVATQVAKGVESHNWIKQSVHLWGQAFWLNLFRDGNPIPDGAHLDKGTTEGLMDGYWYSFTDGLKGMLRAKGDIPDLTVVHYVGLDIFTHYPRRFMVKEHWTVHQIQRWYLKEVLDSEMGKIRNFLEENRLFENTVFFFVADHGQTKITKHIDEKHFVERFPKKFNIMGRRCSMRKADIVVMPGASTKAIYIRNRLKADWMSPPSLFEDVKPVVDASIKIDDMGQHFKTLLVGRYPGERDAAHEESDGFWCFDLYAYLYSDRQQNDFVAALKPLAALDRLVGKELKASYMYNHDFSRKNKPDIILINRPGHYFTPDEGKYAHHGSIYPDDAFVSFVLSGPAVPLFSTNPRTVTQQIDTVDLVPMIAYLAGIEIERPVDGKCWLTEVR